MKTLKEHNEAVMKEYFVQRKAGVVCDECGEEMVYTSAIEVSVKCPDCGYTGSKATFVDIWGYL